MALALAVVTDGYLWAAILVMGLYAVLRGHVVSPFGLLFGVERPLAIALAVGTFLVAMAILFPIALPAE